ncbi:dihydrofolate reductase [Salinirubrum litoreum]|uniref:dihydrofolate reductase n=1 Tax=Salinirubrum litoreum TaxID=1126234 RepID=A0ABD5R9D0_9EURY|nr:dihydrofolate reductase [Salinirubrum litoreum]
MTGDHESSAGDDADPGDDEIEIALIAAVAANGVVGADGSIPWHYSADLRHFKETTTGHPVILGRKTYENVVAGLGEPFPDRLSVVLTETLSDLPEGAVAVGSVEEALSVAREAAREMGVETIYVAGGSAVYEAFLPLAGRLVLTELHGEYEGDRYFPEVRWDDWRETSRETGEDFDFVEYRRVS